MLRLRRLRRKPPALVLEPTSDHTFDFTAEDFTAEPPLVIVHPAVVHLAAHLEGFTAERQRVLEQSVCGNGWPAVWRRWHDRPGGWRAFRDMCLNALDRFHADGTPLVHSLILSEWERVDGFMPEPERRV
jgi:hypothetical protein